MQTTYADVVTIRETREGDLYVWEVTAPYQFKWAQYNTFAARIKHEFRWILILSWRREGVLEIRLNDRDFMDFAARNDWVDAANPLETIKERLAKFITEWCVPTPSQEG